MLALFESNMGAKYYGQGRRNNKVSEVRFVITKSI